MKLFCPAEIAQYAHDHTRAPDPVLDRLAAYTHEIVPLPQMQVGRVEGSLLMVLAALMGARRILEIGTYTGYSALCMAQGLPSGGELITLDRSEESTEVAKRFWAQSPHGSKIELVLGDALVSLRALGDELFDMAFVDADKARYPVYNDEIMTRLRPGGLIAFDNALWSGAVLAPHDDDSRGIAALNDKAQSDDAVDNVLLTIRDGLLLVRKR